MQRARFAVFVKQIIYGAHVAFLLTCVAIHFTVPTVAFHLTTVKGPNVTALASVFVLLFSLLFLLVGYLACSIFFQLVILSRRQFFALAGSDVPPLFAPSRPAFGRPLPSDVGRGGAAFVGVLS